MKPARGFTLLEILVAMALLALIAGLLMGSLALTGRSIEGGEAKAEASAGMRLAEEFLRSQLEGSHPARWRKVAGLPLLFGGERDEVRFAAAIPARVSGGGIYYYRLAVVRDADRSPLVLERVIPELGALEPTDFREAERSILAGDVEELRVGYYGRDPGSAEAMAPTWRDRWDDPQRMPLMIRIDVKPKRDAAWPSLYVTPRQGPEAGCRAWDAGQQRCVQV